MTSTETKYYLDEEEIQRLKLNAANLAQEALKRHQQQLQQIETESKNLGKNILLLICSYISYSSFSIDKVL